MNSPSDLLSADYLASLRFRVDKDTAETLQTTPDVGRTAVKHGVEPLKIANMPIEDTAHAARADSGDLAQLNAKLLSDTEKERREISLHLNDEITQTLLGIYVQMTALRNEIAANNVNHNHDIAMIQKMVGDSIDMIRVEVKHNGESNEADGDMKTMTHNGLGRWCSRRRKEAKSEQ